VRWFYAVFSVKVSRFGPFVGVFAGVFRFAFCVYDRGTSHWTYTSFYVIT